ncbi:MAG: pirin family protein [Myxococcales bacterium]|nr:pirin family protein [Myxococcales bacterium]
MRHIFMSSSRRDLLRCATVALVASACRKKPMPDVRHRPLASLPTTTLPWLSLRDHFIATVGPSAGQGSRLGPLLVLADATFAPRSRFPLHPHQEIEILSIVIEGDLSHHGDQAHGAMLKKRDVQLISSRDGMTHAEGNETDTSTRMLQLWFEPTSHGGAPAYFRRTVGIGSRQPVAGDDVLPLRCDAKVWWSDVRGTETVTVAAGRAAYVMALDAPVGLSTGVTLAVGEGAEVGAGEVQLMAASAAVLIIDLPRS